MTEQEKIKFIENLRPIDDIFFEVLARDKKVCEEILRVIMGDDKLEVKESITQKSERNLYGRGVILDALCKLKDNRYCNIEVQRGEDEDHLRRVRYNGSLITAKQSNKGDEFDDVIELYIIFITEKDFLGLGKTMYTVKKKIMGTDVIIEDGLTEIYVNAEIDDGSLVAELMKEFKSKNPNNKKFKHLTGRSKEIKQDGGKKMNALLKEYFKEDLIDARERGIKLGEKRGEERGIKLGEERGIKLGEKRGIKLGEKKGEKQGLNRGLFSLVQKGLITKEQAIENSTDKQAFLAMFETKN